VNLQQILAQPLIWFYHLTGAYWSSIIIFTIIINIVLFPLQVKQQQSMAKQSVVKPKIDRLKEKCGNDKRKLQQETMALYQKENVSMAGGCLPSLLQIVVLMIVYQGIYYCIGPSSPMPHVSHFSLNPSQNAFVLFGYFDLTQKAVFNIDIAHAFTREWLIPIMACAAQFLSSIVNMRIMKATNPSAPNMGAMMYLFPLMSLFIGFSFVTALGFYWTVSALVMLAKQLIVAKYYSVHKYTAERILDMGAKRRGEEQKKVAAKN